ncbi:MAG TPA: hypothetical protein VKP66_07280 [Steroidobacteraceae bacterium]|nr:hypothetical protein [Steroidobacteraceae bacterium]
MLEDYAVVTVHGGFGDDARSQFNDLSAARPLPSRDLLGVTACVGVSAAAS